MKKIEYLRVDQLHPHPANPRRYRYVRAVSKYNPDISAPEDAETAAYVYYRRDNYIYLYRENPKDEAVDHAAEKKKRLDAELEEINKELELISSNHLDARISFLVDFTDFNTSSMDIDTFAVKALLYAVDNHITIDANVLGEFLNVPVDADDELDPAAWNKALFNMPQKVLLCTAYTMLEGTGQSYNIRKYDPKTAIRLPIVRQNLALDLIYSALKSLGYELSDEEKQMKDGTHPLYLKAKRLVDEYLKEKEENDG